MAKKKAKISKKQAVAKISIFFYIRIGKVGQTLFQCGKFTFLWPEPEDFHTRVKRGYETWGWGSEKSEFPKLEKCLPYFSNPDIGECSFV
jgi:hypothetical protein